MKVTKLNLDPERKLITYMIVNESFLREIAPIIDPMMLESGYARLVSQWVLDYWKHYQTPPGKDIQTIYQTNRDSIGDEDDADNVASFLKGLSKEYDAIEVHNVEFEVRQATKYLKLRAMRKLIDQLESAADAGEPEVGETAIANYKRVERPTGEGVSIFRDPRRIASSFMEDEPPILQFPGALGDMVGPLDRGDFFAFMAPMKRGKTWWMGYAAELCALSGLKVVWFSLEMPERSLVRRSYRGLIGQPLKPGEIIIPYFDDVSSEADESNVVHRIKYKASQRSALDPSQIKSNQVKLRRIYRGGDIRLISLPPRTTDINDITSRLDTLAYYDNYQADVVVVDYADIMAPARGFRGDYRHALDDIWLSLRRLATTRNILVISASQGSKSTFDGDASMGDVAEDIRKLAHVTSMLAINQSEAEQEAGICRLKQLVVRESAKSFDQVVALQCLDLGRACIDSRPLSSVIMPDTVQLELDRRNGKRKK